jgi:hypothetical protein
MGLVAPWSKAICPFCFNRFHLSQAARRWTLPDAPKEKDTHVGTFLSLPPPEMGKVEPPRRGGLLRLLRRLVVWDDWKSGAKKICPNCHMFLPHATASGQLSSDIVAIIGARSSGKSNYFGVLLNALEQRYAREVDFLIYDQETFSTTEMRPISSKKLYRERYGRRLFESPTCMAIDQNRSAAQDRFLRIPLIYRLEFRLRPIHYLTRPFRRVNAMDLVIFDAAGEDMEDPIALEQFYSYILGAAGIIFIIDPFQYPGIRSRLPPNLLPRFPKIPVDPAEVVSRVINLFERRAGLRVGQKISVPVAFAFSKSDLLNGVVHPTSPILRDSQHPGGFNLEDCRRVSEEVMECVREFDSPQLVDLAEKKFRSYCFFAMSALGQLPDEQLRIRPPDPRRVADPLLWIFWKRRYIPALKN